MVFQDKKFGDFINSHFVSIKINGKKGKGSKLKKKLNVLGYPTVLFLTSEGKELYRTVGFDGNKDMYLLAVDYLTTGKWKGFELYPNEILQPHADYATMNRSLKDDLSRLETNTDNIDLNFMVAFKYTYRYEIEKAYQYFQKVLALDPQNQKGYRDVATYNTAIYAAKIDKNIEPLHTFLKNTSFKQFIEIGYPNLVNLYGRIEEKNPDTMVGFYEESLEKLPHNTNILNGYAWYIYENKIKDKYERGIELAQKAVELAPDKANIWDTLAWLYYEKGEIIQALNAMKKAVELAPNAKMYKKNLDKMKSVS